jgi:hypothetical protein
LRSGRRQEVAVDLRQAVASLRSGHYLQVNGAKVGNERNPVRLDPRAGGADLCAPSPSTAPTS